MQSPHLPNKSSSLRQRDALMTLPWLLLFCALAAVIAAAVSTAFLAWYVPDFVRYQVPVSITTQQQNNSADSIDPLLARNIGERQVQLFVAEAAADVFTADQYVTDAIVLSSDGWIAFVAPRQQNMVALDADGEVYTIEQFVTDPNSEITYAKLSEGNFLVTSIAQWTNDTHQNAAVWVRTAFDWEQERLDERVGLQDTSVLSLYEPYDTYQLPLLRDGGIVYAQDGAFLGFVADDAMIPGWRVSHALSYVLAERAIPAAPVGFTGEVVSAYRDTVSNTFIDTPALRITSLPTSVSTTLQAGDILTMIDDRSVSPMTIAKELWLRDTVTMQVLRDGAPLTVRYSH